MKQIQLRVVDLLRLVVLWIKVSPGYTVDHVVEGGQQSLLLDVIHVGEELSLQKHFLQGLHPGPFRHALRSLDHVGKIVQDEGPNGNIGDVAVGAPLLPVVGGAVVFRGSVAVRPGAIQAGAHRHAAVPAFQHLREDVCVPDVSPQVSDGPLGVGVHDSVGAAPYLLADDRLMIALYDDLLRQGLFRPGLCFVIIAVGPLVERVADHISDCFAGPLPSPLCFHTVH